MRNRLAKTLLAALTITAVAIPAGAQARQGADDAVGHVRHASHVTTTKSKAHHRHARHHHRHGRGNDDGPNHR
jgi:Ni/Co efflux regulator RcnB